MKRSRILALILALVLSVGTSFAQHKNSSRPYYGGGQHSRSHGGHYQGGQNSHHKGGHYKNPKTHDHYGKHKPS
jgi:hypothetical protein